MKTAGRFAAILWLTLMAGVAIAETHDPASIPLVTGDDYAPFTGRDLPRDGLTTHIIRRIFVSMNQPVEISFRPWERGYREALNGQFAGTFPYIRSPDREALNYYSAPLFEVDSYAYVAKDSMITAQGPEDLAGLTLCLPLGYAPGPVLERMITAGSVERVSPPDMPSCFQMLAAGRVHFVKINRYVAREILRNAGVPPSEVRALPFRVESLEHHFIVPRNQPDGAQLIERFNTALERMRESGELGKLIDDYFRLYYSGNP